MRRPGRDSSSLEDLALKKVIVIGPDRLEPTILQTLLATGELPNLARLRAEEAFSKVATTTPTQVNWPLPGPIRVAGIVARQFSTHSGFKNNTVELTVKSWEAVGYFALSPCGRG